MSTEFVFQMTPLDAEVLLPQVSGALEVYNEQQSRHRYPTLWRWIDRLRRVPKVPAEVRKKRRRRRTVLGLINWCLGMLLLVSALTEPRQLGLLLAVGAMGTMSGIVVLWRHQRILLGVLSVLGAFVLCVVGYGSPAEFGNLQPMGIGLAVFGLACLFTGRRQRVTAYERAAKALLTRATDPQTMGPICFLISEQGLTLEMCKQPGARYTVPLDQLEYIIETGDLFLPIYAGSVTVLQKRDLMSGTRDGLREFLADRLVQTGL